jgi:exodeoxyribonuclease-3
MRILSWNVNGLRACLKKGFLDWLAASGADVVGLQEVRAPASELPAEVLAPDGWQVHLVAAQRQGYSGVMLWSRARPDSLETSLGRPDFDCEGRVQLARFGRLTVANVYFPNGQGKERDNSRVPFKLDFYRTLFDRLEPARAAGEPVLVMGDFNTAHRPIDLARPKANEGTSGFLPEERAELDRWLSHGWTDTFRHVRGDVKDVYTWWSQMFRARTNNVGWRIDYVLASPGAVPLIKDAFVLPEVLGSDHCPVGVELADA